MPGKGGAYTRQQLDNIKKEIQHNIEKGLPLAELVAKREEENKEFIKELRAENGEDWVIENFDDLRYAMKMITRGTYTKLQLKKIKRSLQPQGFWYKEFSTHIIRFLWERNEAEKAPKKVSKGKEKKSERTIILEAIIKITDNAPQVCNTLCYDHTSLLHELITSTEAFKALEGLRNAASLNKEAKRVLSSRNKRGGKGKGHAKKNPPRKSLIKNLIEFHKKHTKEKLARGKPPIKRYNFIWECLLPLKEIENPTGKNAKASLNQAITRSA